MAIFEEKDQKALLGACESDNEFIPIWLMLRAGWHPSDVSMASKKLRFNGQFIEWKRAKNAKNRREKLPPDMKPRLEKWLRHGRKLTRVGYFQLVRRVGTRIGHCEYTPMTLRHSFCLTELRGFMRLKHPPADLIDLVALRMGCSREVVMQNYIDLAQWESVR